MVVSTASMRKSRPGPRRSVSVPRLELQTLNARALMLALSVRTAVAAHAVTGVAPHAAAVFNTHSAQSGIVAARRIRPRLQGQAHKRGATPILKERADRVRDGLWSWV